jgi:hypothetical protein
MVRRQGYISAPGVRFGTMYRKSGSTWEHRSGRGAPVMPNNPFSTGVNAGKAPF